MSRPSRLRVKKWHYPEFRVIPLHTSPAPEVLGPLLKYTIKTLLSPNNAPPDTSPRRASPASPSPSPDSPASQSAEERFKAHSRERHAQEFSDTGNARRFVTLHRDHL